MPKVNRWSLTILVVCFLGNLYAQKLSIGIEFGPNLKSFNQFTPSPDEPSFYFFFKHPSHNEGWVVSYYTQKEWLLTATLTQFFPTAGIGAGEPGQASGRAVSLPDRTWSIRLGKQWDIWKNRIFIEPSLGMGFTNVKVRDIGRDAPDLLQLYDYTYQAGWKANYQACLRLGYNFKKSSLSVKAIGLQGRKYYLTYHYKVNTEGVIRNVDISTKGDIFGLQLCYEYIFNLKKKK